MLNFLSEYYKKSIDKAQEYLQSKYELNVCPRDDSEIPSKTHLDFVAHWKITINRPDIQVQFIISLPPTFPDRLPTIYISRGDFKKIYPIPHLDVNRIVCTRDAEVICINDNKPGEAIEKLIEIALETIKKGINEENIGDFESEYLAYWNDKIEYALLALFNPSDTPSLVQICKLSGKIYGSELILSDDLKKLQHWIEPFNITYTVLHDVLYLPFEQPIKSIPQTEKDILGMINGTFTKEANQYISTFPSKPIIVVSFPLNGERMMFAWGHKAWSDGFRPSASFQTRLLRDFPLERVGLIRLDKERILKRGGADKLSLSNNLSIGMIGCGSIGSQMVMSLAKCGVDKFCLIDPDLLNPENVARHLCGMVEAANKPPKVSAVKKKIINHFPDIDCVEYQGDVLDLLQREEIDLNIYDLLIVATANMAAERRINELVRKKIIRSKVVFVWLEPHGVGGHILYVDPSEGGCYKCCFNLKGEFLYSIAALGQQLDKRECGCQSTFWPYSSLDVEQFVAICTKKIFDMLENTATSTTLYSWMGDTDRFTRLGYRIDDMWIANSPYTVVRTNIDKQKGCCAIEE